ncbi:MAG: type II toxin-antitoxin system VapC family toxin [Cyanobacteria bacterium P01_A01_bin.123]
MSRHIFLDTSYVIALSCSSDQLHDKARQLADQLDSLHFRMVTTQAILLEIGNALSKRRHRSAAIELLESLDRDPNVEIILLSKSLYEDAFSLFCNRLDKEWGLVDCLSFVVMKERQITDALTADMHFQQMGFRALLNSVNETFSG